MMLPIGYQTPRRYPAYRAVRLPRFRLALGWAPTAILLALSIYYFTYLLYLLVALPQSAAELFVGALWVGGAEMSSDGARALNLLMGAMCATVIGFGLSFALIVHRVRT